MVNLLDKLLRKNTAYDLDPRQKPAQDLDPESALYTNWDELLPLLESLGNVYVEFPDGPSLDGSTFPGKYALSDYFYSGFELPNTDFVNTIRSTGHAIFKHSIVVDLCAPPDREQIIAIYEYLQDLPSRPVKLRIEKIDDDFLNVGFYQHHLMHVPAVEATRSVPASDPLTLYDRKSVDLFFQDLKDTLEGRGYLKTTAEDHFKMYVLPHKSSAIQPSLFNIVSIPESKLAPLISDQRYAQLSLGADFEKQQARASYAMVPGGEPDVFATNLGLRINELLGR